MNPLPFFWIPPPLRLDPIFLGHRPEGPRHCPGGSSLDAISPQGKRSVEDGGSPLGLVQKRSFVDRPNARGSAITQTSRGHERPGISPSRPE